MSIFRRHYSILWFILLTLAAAVPGYYRLLTGFSEWDDEGSLMMSVQQYLQGHRLYAELVSGYGPIYYFYNWAIRTLSGTTVTHNAVRLSAMLPLLAASLICAWYIFQLTRSLALASLVHLATVVMMLRFFPNEPGHPQELCILLLACFIGAGQLVSQERWRPVGVILLGAIAAALSLVKVNIGMFVILGGALAVLFHLPRTRLVRLATLATAFVAVTLPFALLKNHLDDPPIQTFLFVVVASLVALLLRLISSRRPEIIGVRDCWLAVAGFTAVFIAILLSLKMRGIGLLAVLDSLVLSNLRLSIVSGVFYLPPRLSGFWALVAVAGVAVCLIVMRFEKNRARSGGASSAVAMLKLFMGVAAIGMSMVGTPLGLMPFLAWLAVSPPSEALRAVQSFPRTLLCSVGTLQTLYAYPVAGSQDGFIKIPLLLMAALCVGDLPLSLPVRFHAWWTSLKWVTAVGLMGVLLGYALQTYRSKQRYDSLPSLAMRGAERIHVNAKQAQEYQWLTSNIERYCDVIFGLPNIPSLHFWTRRDPITPLTWDAWILTATAEQQRMTQAALSEHQDACIVYNPELVSVWNSTGRLDVDSLPLVQYIHAEFRTGLEMDGYRLLVRSNRTLKDPSSGSGKTF